MCILQNRIQKNFISVILITALILSGLFSYPNASYGLTQYVTTTYYRLDTGVIFLWKNSSGIWQYGREPGGSDTFSTDITIPKYAENVTAAAYDQDADYGEDGYFPFKATEKIDGSSIIWNKTVIAKNKYDYDDNYNKYATCPLSVNKEYTSTTGDVKIIYDATFHAYGGTDYNVKEKLENGLKQEIIDLLGSPSAEITEAMDLMNPESENYDSDVEGYLYFLPVVIKYDITEVVEIGDFEPGLDLPESAKQGEEYTVSDGTIVDNECEIDRAVLEKHYGDGIWEEVATWNGPGEPGANTGGSIDESCSDVGTITYRLTVYDIYGQSDTATASIEITDRRDISVTADLVLPPYTFEGHKMPATDRSTFEVDGVNYSAERAYAEKIARNSFKENTAYGTVSRLTSTQANVTFSKSGTYNVTLTVTPVAGGKATDTEPIEVKKTPYIIDSLGGFQKQNRKQILSIAVATFPGKPITEYSITLKDKKTGGSIILTEDNLQENTATIKTRTVEITEDEAGEYAYITVEFLTKTPAYNPAHPDSTQDFYYEIKVKDSKGDTDSASKNFAVKPDIPPTAAISLDSAFLRNEGTNIASIKAEDVTVASDGDDVSRTWYYGATTAPSIYTDVSTMDGYSRLSFGTDKIIGFNKVGVGKFATKLYVKEVWTEPTLSEYVSSSDYLTGAATAYSDVQNVAPVVSLELLEGLEQKVLLLAKSTAEYQTLLNNKTSLMQTLLSNQVDAQFIIKKLLGNSPSGVSGITNELTYTYAGPVWSSGIEEEADYTYITADSEKTYIATWTWISNAKTVPITIHAYNPFSGQVWTYATTRNEAFKFGNDDTGKYLYLIYYNSNQTVVLDKETGTVAGTINIALSDKVWLTDDLIFTVKDGDLYAINRNTLASYLVDSDVYTVARVSGGMQYVTKTDSGLVRNILNTETLSVTKQLLIETDKGISSASNYTPVSIDSAGTAVVYKTAGTGSDTFNGLRVYNAKNSLSRQIAGAGGTTGIFAPVDEKGICNHVLMWGWSSGGSNGFVAFNLNTGTTATWSKTATYSFLRTIGGCTACFEVGGVSYYYFPGWYITAGSGYFGNSYILSYNGTGLSGGVGGPGSIGTTDENYAASDRVVSSLFGNSATGVIYFKISSFAKTLVQETAEAIARFANEHAFVGGIGTTPDQIKEAANAAEKVVKVTANNNGYLYLNNLSLVPDKKYYYDYEVQPLTAGTKSSLTGITASTGTTTSTQTFNGDMLYVADSYYEDFNDTDIDDNFTVSDSGQFVNGMYGSDASNSDYYMTLTFTVPTGKQAIVSFDYYLANLDSDDYATANVFVDGARMNESALASSYPASGSKIFYQVLAAGSHTISTNCYTGNWDPYVLIDNLRVDILSTTAGASIDKYSTSDNDDWVDFSGCFKTPNKIISYGAQSSTNSTAALPSAVTATYTYKNKVYVRTTEYYETVPRGYLQKGYIHLASSYIYSRPNVDYTVAGGSTYEYRSDGTVDTWAFTGVKSAGTYTHIAHIDASSGPRYYQAYIDGFRFTTYPDNEVTRTGNMAFNSTNTEYFFPKASSTGLTNLSMYLPKGEYLIKNLKIYYIENGKKIFLQNKSLEDITELPNWSLSSGLTASNATIENEEPADDEYIKIYKKGQKVIYNIFYSDYEEDPSKTQYWIYQHINWPPDPVHPDAGKVLNRPIDRFYLSGKYTVTHWQPDNTQRTGTVGDASPYNRESNKVDLVFYVDGGGEAPWVTYIKTNPQTVKENNSFTIAVGVDDAEKDTLRLETEVYLNGKRILDHIRENLKADAGGNYPETIVGGLPSAKPGICQVICTVSDYSGTGIKSYKFTVVSEGRVNGFVNHTDQWDANRKKYNLKRFSEEVNRTLQLNDYIAMSAPRMRGTNVFWSGEKFMLRAETEGESEQVSVEILSRDAQGGLKSTGYSAELADTGRKTSGGARLWEGSLWNAAMINKWGKKAPEELIFRFTAYYPGNVAKTHTVSVIMDSDRDYWQLHRLW